MLPRIHLSSFIHRNYDRVERHRLMSRLLRVGCSHFCSMDPQKKMPRFSDQHAKAVMAAPRLSDKILESETHLRNLDNVTMYLPKHPRHPKPPRTLIPRGSHKRSQVSQSLPGSVTAHWQI